MRIPVADPAAGGIESPRTFIMVTPSWRSQVYNYLWYVMLRRDGSVWVILFASHVLIYSGLSPLRIARRAWCLLQIESVP